MWITDSIAAGHPNPRPGQALRLVSIGYRHAAPIPYDATTSDTMILAAQLVAMVVRGATGEPG